MKMIRNCIEDINYQKSINLEFVCNKYCNNYNVKINDGYKIIYLITEENLDKLERKACNLLRGIYGLSCS